MTLYDQLTTLLTTTLLLWPSETDSPIEGVRMKPEDLIDWEYYNDGYTAIHIAATSFENQDRPGWQKLRALFAEYESSAYRRPSGKPAEYDLVVLIKDGAELVGIRSVLVET